METVYGADDKSEPNDDGAAQIFRDVRTFISKDAEMQADRERLIHVCCAPEIPPRVQGAPIPASLVAIVAECNLKC